MADAYANWKARLRGDRVPLTSGVAEAGFWRYRSSKDSKYHPLAVWPANDGSLVYKMGTDDVEDVTPEWADSIFSSASRFPVAEQFYRTALRTGAWHDDVEKAMPTGSNMPVTDHEKIVAELADEEEAITQWLAATKIETQEQADKATNWIAKIDTIRKRRDKAFDEEKKPIREAATDCDTRWNKPKTTIERLVRTLKEAQRDFLVAKDQREKAEAAEARRVRDEAARDATRQREGEAPGPGPLAAREHSPASRPTRASSGTAGRKVGLSDVRVGVIIDLNQALAWIAKNKPYETREFIQSFADKAAKADFLFDGIEIKTTREVR